MKRHGRKRAARSRALKSFVIPSRRLQLQPDGSGEEYRTAKNRALRSHVPNDLVLDVNRSIALATKERETSAVPSTPLRTKRIRAVISTSLLPGFLQHNERSADSTRRSAFSHAPKSFVQTFIYAKLHTKEEESSAITLATSCAKRPQRWERNGFCTYCVYVCLYISARYVQVYLSVTKLTSVDIGVEL